MHRPCPLQPLRGLLTAAAGVHPRRLLPPVVRCFPQSLRFPWNSNSVVSFGTASFPTSFPASSASFSLPSSVCVGNPVVDVYLSLGSNQGDTVHNIHTAMKFLTQPTRAGITLPMHAQLNVINTSFLYSTSPLYVTDQAPFLNCCVHVRTNLLPLHMLALCKEIEKKMGRQSQAYIRHGPRCIDLDIVFYSSLSFTHPLLVVPHPRWAERGFVLRPMLDILQLSQSTRQDQPLQLQHYTTEQAQIQHSNWMQDITETYNKWTCKQEERKLEGQPLDNITRILPFPTISSPNNMCPVSPTSRTIVMGILNVTPDSFSSPQPGVFQANPVQAAVEMWEQGADIIDIGGESTRPGATIISEQEELARVMPVIEQLQALHPHIKLSIDTYKPVVAACAVTAGCCMINDVSGGTYISPTSSLTMRSVAALQQVPYVCMHRRGDAQTMASQTHYQDILREVTDELTRALTNFVQPTLSSAISTELNYQWQMIADPGIGFAKQGDQNLWLLRHLASIFPSKLNYPLLMGVSRKRFITQALKFQRNKEVRSEGLITTLLHVDVC